MEEELRSHLVTCANAYAAAAVLSLTTVGGRAANDWRFFDRVAAGAGFTVSKYDEVVGWFSANWPAETAWPADVPRPEVAAAPPPPGEAAA